jgi:acyl-CoA synthetase (AMP-forming)/AMP-acid ligase II
MAPPTPPPSGASAPRGLAAIAAADPERVALVAGADRVTFGRLDRAANAVAHTLAAAGVGPGDRVAVMLDNGPEVFAAWYGAARRGP